VFDGGDLEWEAGSLLIISEDGRCFGFCDGIFLVPWVADVG
jgi:hypothetical protein